MEISAKKRDLLRRKTKNLRKEGFIPAVLYSSDSSRGDKEILNLTLKTDEFKRVYKDAGTSALVKLSLDEGKKTNILISQVQIDPITLTPIHAGLFEVDMKEQIETEIPVKIINDDVHDLVKNGEGIVILLQSSIKVKCLPADLPHEFIIDALVFKAVGDIFKVESLNVDRTKVELLIDSEEGIAKLDFALQQEQAVEEAPMSVDQIEVITPEKKEKDEDEDKKGE